MKTLSELKEKPYFRFFKVLYFLLTVPLVVPLYIAFDEGWSELLFWIFVYLIILEIIKRVVYYIFLGKINPPK